MRSEALLRKFGWRQSKGKWIAKGHSRPLTLTQAKTALARDLKSKNFDALKQSGKLLQAQAAIERGYLYDQGKFKTPRGRKQLSLEQVESIRLKDELSAKNVGARQLGFVSDKERKSIADWTRENLRLYRRFVNQYNETQGGSDINTRAKIAKLLYQFKQGKSKSSRQKALNDLLIFVGYRTGNEPYPAGQTPPKK